MYNVRVEQLPFVFFCMVLFCAKKCTLYLSSLKAAFVIIYRAVSAEVTSVNSRMASTGATENTRETTIGRPTQGTVSWEFWAMTEK